MTEGVRCSGYRTIALAGTRDPILLSQVDVYLENVRQRVGEVYGGEGYRLLFHVYGRDGVMGALETTKESRAHELGLVIEVVADDPETSAAILALARSAALHSRRITRTPRSSAIRRRPTSIPSPNGARPSRGPSRSAIRASPTISRCSPARRRG